MRGGPAEIAGRAAILDWPKDGKGPYRVLRRGTNGWSCFPSEPSVPGDHPSCLDANGLAWLDAYYAGKTPHLRGVGIWYWPLGSADASNTDPLATKPAPGQSWVIDGPHLTILPADPGVADSYAGYGTHHHGGVPALMFPGTPYVHLHVPIG